MDNGRHQNAARVREAQANGEGSAVTGVKITVKLNYGDETTDERRTKHAQATGTSRGLWK